MKLRNKFVLIAIVLILLIFTLSCSVFASYTINGDYDGQHYEISLPDSLSEFNYKLIFVVKKGDYYWPDIFLSNDSFSFIGDKDYPGYVRLSLSREGQEVFRYSPGRGQSDVGACLSQISSFDISSFELTSTFFCVYKVENVFFASQPISSFFPTAPQMVEPLTEITQVEEIQPAVVKIVGIVLPVCLMIFGVLLVLYLIKSKNLLQL